MSSTEVPTQPAPSRGQQRRARVLAFQVLYEVDVAGHRPADVLDRLARDTRASGPAFEYARHLVAGVAHHRRDIDRIIRRFARAWPLAQMAAADRTVLRLGIFEAVYNSTTIPVGLAVSEAVDLAKRFGSESSSRFVNGVLGRVVVEVGRAGPRLPAQEPL